MKTTQHKMHTLTFNHSQIRTDVHIRAGSILQKTTPDLLLSYTHTRTPHLGVLVEHDHVVGEAVGRARADDHLDAAV